MHKVKLLVPILLSILIGLGLAQGVALAAAPASTTATTWTVCASSCNFTTISDAISNASVVNGDTIEVKNSTHTEAGITINKDLVIAGEGEATTTVQAAASQASASDRVFSIASGASVTIRDLTIRYGNVSGDGGGINNQGNLILTDVKIQENKASSYGGGLCNQGGSTAMLDGVTILENIANNGGGMDNRGDYGVGVYVTVTMTATAFTKNDADSYGGGLANWSTTMTLTNVTFDQNGPVSQGGAMYNDQSTVNLTGGTFTNDQGNAAVYNNNGQVTMADVEFTGNTNTALYNSNCDAVLTNAIFTGNSDTALYNSESDPVLTNAVFEGNNGIEGGAIYNYSSNPILTNITVVSNTASVSGGGIYNYQNSDPVIRNAVIWGNSATTAGDQIHNRTPASDTPIISYSLIQDSNGSGAGWDTSLGADGGNNIDPADPLFFSEYDDLRLKGGSEGIDSGDNSVCPDADVRGESRDDWQCDMGAYETQLSDTNTVSKVVSGGNTYTFGPTLGKIEVVNDGSCLTGLSVQRMAGDHANATPGIQTGRYWDITPTGCTSSFTLKLTLPYDGAVAATDKLCRYTGSGWDCGEQADHATGTNGPTAMPNIITRSGVTTLSNWAVGKNVTPTRLGAVEFTAAPARGAAFVMFGAALVVLVAGSVLFRRRSI